MVSRARTSHRQEAVRGDVMQTTYTGNIGTETLTMAKLCRFSNEARSLARKIERIDEQLLLHCAKNVNKWLWYWLNPRRMRKRCSTRKSKAEGKKAMKWIGAIQSTTFVWPKAVGGGEG